MDEYLGIQACTMRLRDVPLDMVPLVYLRASAKTPAFYWSSPDRQERITAVGVAHRVEAQGPDRWQTLKATVERVSAQLRATAAGDRPLVLCWFTGLAFDEAHPGGGDGPDAAISPIGGDPSGLARERPCSWWRVFPSAVAVLPAIIVIDRPRGRRLTVVERTARGRWSKWLSDVANQKVDRKATPVYERTMTLVELIERAAWWQRENLGLNDPFNQPPIPGMRWPVPRRPANYFRDSIAMLGMEIEETIACEDGDGSQEADRLRRRLLAAQEWLASGPLEQLVVAEPRCVRLSQRVDPIGILVRMIEQEPSCHHLLYTPVSDTALVGASPRRLLRVEGRRLWTAALSGAAPRHADEAADRELGATLLATALEDEKHQRLVNVVRDGLRQLAPAVRRVRVAETPHLRSLANIQHRETAITAQRHRSVSLLDIAERLQPTPASAGWPTAVAKEAIRAIEGLSRGWYGGVVGWLDDQGNGDLAIVSRALVLRGDEALTQAGATVTRGSDLEALMAEVELKLKAALAPLTKDLRQDFGEDEVGFLDTNLVW